MTKLDFTQPLSLRCDPFTQFKEAFSNPDCDGRRYGSITGIYQVWNQDGSQHIGKEDPYDLIPLQYSSNIPRYLRADGIWAAFRDPVDVVEHRPSDGQMTKLDFTQPLALRYSPYMQVNGPFIGPDDAGIVRAIIKGSCYVWHISGNYVGRVSSFDLVPLQVRPVKWVITDVVHLDRPGITCMIERAAADGLVKAVRDHLDLHAYAHNHPLKHALVAYETGL